MLGRIATLCAVGLLAFSCADGPISSRVQVAEIRALEAESAARLALEGQSEYDGDDTKRSGFEYCVRSIELAERGEFRRAIREASKALYLGLSGGDQYLLANAKRDLASAYFFAGDVDRAELYAREAIIHLSRSTVGAERHDQVLIPVTKTLGDIELRRGRADSAIATYGKVLERARGDARARIRAALGNAYLVRNHLERAREAFTEAEKEANPQLRPIIERGVAEIALASGDYAAAVRRFEEVARGAAGDEGTYHRMWALYGIARAKRAGGDSAGALTAYEEAAKTADSVRARFRSEEFKTGFFADAQSIFDEAIELTAAAGQHERAFALSEQARARALLDLIRGRVDLSEERHAIVRASSAPRVLKDVQSVVPANAAMVIYHSGPRRTYGWVLRRAGLEAFTIESAASAIQAEISGFRRAIGGRSADVDARAHSLHRLLLAPARIRPGEQLILVAHGDMHHLPFQALRVGDRWLIEEHEISYAPSAAVFAYLAARERPAQRRVLALGNPDLGSPRLALPGAQREVTKLRDRFADATVFIGKEASKRNLIGSAPASEIVHVAAHATVDEIDPLFSEILLADAPDMPGRLEAHELYRLKLTHSPLVVLSACESGTGRISRGDEQWGFTRTVLGAGARTLVASLWPVEDLATERLMDSFYSALNRTSAAAALREAQRAVLSDPSRRDPLFWSAFNLIGDPR
jgi:CHAT domain-containing protein